MFVGHILKINSKMEETIPPTQTRSSEESFFSNGLRSPSFMDSLPMSCYVNFIGICTQYHTLLGCSERPPTCMVCFVTRVESATVDVIIVVFQGKNHRVQRKSATLRGLGVDRITVNANMRALRLHSHRTARDMVPSTNETDTQPSMEAGATTKL